MSDTPWLSPFEAATWRAYLEMTGALEAAVTRQLVTWGLSIPDYDVLARLSQTPQGALRARELRESLGWDRSRLSHQLRRMEKRDLVRRSDCIEDARGTMIEITGRGRAAVESAAPGHAATVRRHLFEVATSAEVTALHDLATRVRDRRESDADPEAATGTD